MKKPIPVGVVIGAIVAVVITVIVVGFKMLVPTVEKARPYREVIADQSGFHAKQAAVTGGQMQYNTQRPGMAPAQPGAPAPR